VQFAESITVVPPHGAGRPVVRADIWRHQAMVYANPSATIVMPDGVTPTQDLSTTDAILRGPSPQFGHRVADVDTGVRLTILIYCGQASAVGCYRATFRRPRLQPDVAV
jgi:hypothetical protein